MLLSIISYTEGRLLRMSYKIVHYIIPRHLRDVLPSSVSYSSPSFSVLLLYFLSVFLSTTFSHFKNTGIYSPLQTGVSKTLLFIALYFWWISNLCWRLLHSHRKNKYECWPFLTQACCNFYVNSTFSRCKAERAATRTFPSHCTFVWNPGPAEKWCRVMKWLVISSSMPMHLRVSCHHE